MVGTIKQNEFGDKFIIEYLKKDKIGGRIRIKNYPINKQQEQLIIDNGLWEQKVKFELKRYFLNMTTEPFEIAHIFIPERLYKLYEINKYTEHIIKHGIISFEQFVRL